MSVIEIKNLKKYFGDTKAVNGVSFAVEKGEIFGFLGPNGAGKTTTIRCMMDFIRPTDGSVSILEKDAQKDAVELKKKIGFLSSRVNLYDDWTGKAHIDFVQKLNGKSNIARDLIHWLDFNPKIKTKRLSSGNRQKLGLIMALMSEPEVLILDEPTLALDPLFQNAIYKVLEEISKMGATIFMSSHILSEIERLCDRVGIIKEGKMVAIDTVENLKKRGPSLEKVFLDFYK